MRDNILQDLEQIVRAAHAEVDSDEDFRLAYYPLPEHIRALDPEVVLVLGGRGAGKTELFRATQIDSVRLRIARLAPTDRLQRALADPVIWRVGYSGEGKGYPDNRGLRAFFRASGFSLEQGLDFWNAYLLRVLNRDLTLLAPNSASLTAIMEPRATAASGVVSAFQSVAEAATHDLDLLDDKLAEENKYIIVSYDALDAFGGGDADTMTVGISSLLAFWAQYVRRWRRIRPKIFLRPDLFWQYSVSLGADAAKLAAARTEIIWNDRYLYTILIKRFLNSGPSLRSYVSLTRIRGVIEDDVLGFFPPLLSAEDARPVIEKIAAPYMGANVKKGRTYKWVLDHIKDGNQRALPRALLQLFGFAARRELSESRRVGKLLDWSSLRNAINDVSREQIVQSRAEWPWIDGVHDRLFGQEVPMDRRGFELLLSVNFDGNWSSASNDVHVRPPAETPRELVSRLLELGIGHSRPQDRIDVPDLYASGLGLKRRGGVAMK